MNAKMKWGYFLVLAFLLAMPAETLARGGGIRGGGTGGRKPLLGAGRTVSSEFPGGD